MLGKVREGVVGSKGERERNCASIATVYVRERRGRIKVKGR